MYRIINITSFDPYETSKKKKRPIYEDGKWIMDCLVLCVIITIIAITLGIILCWIRLVGL